MSHAGTALLRELAVETGLVNGWTAALIDTYRLPPIHPPGQVLACPAPPYRAPAKSVDHAVSCRFELGGVGVAW